MAIATIQLRRGKYGEMDKSKYRPAEFGVVLADDPNLPSGKAVYVAYAAGDVERLISVEQLEIMIQEGRFKGENGEKGDPGAKGKDGTSVSSANIDDRGHLMISLDDGTEYDAGALDEAFELIQQAITSADEAATSAQQAKSAATQTAADKTATAQSKESAESFAKLSRSYATGDSGSRVGEATDNAKEYARQAQESAKQAEKVLKDGLVLRSEVGAPGGVASLDSGGKVPSAQLPAEKVIDHRILTTGWTGVEFPYLYTINIPNLTATQAVYVTNADGLTETEINAFAESVITGHHQEQGKIVLQAVKIPAVKLPIKIKIGGETSDT